MIKSIKNSSCKLIKMLKLNELMDKFLSVLIPKILTEMLGMPSLTDKYLKTKNSITNKCFKAKVFSESLKEVRHNFKNKIKTNSEKNIQDINNTIKKSNDFVEKTIHLYDKTDDSDKNSNVVVGAVKHIISGVSDNFSNNNNEEKLLKIKNGKTTSAPVSDDESNNETKNK